MYEVRTINTLNLIWYEVISFETANRDRWHTNKSMYVHMVNAGLQISPYSECISCRVPSICCFHGQNEIHYIILLMHGALLRHNCVHNSSYATERDLRAFSRGFVTNITSLKFCEEAIILDFARQNRSSRSWELGLVLGLVSKCVG